MSHASEQGHYYRQDGTPAYTVIGKNGKERPTDIRDARRLNLVPSVTMIIRQAAAPGLERWKAEQLLMAGLTLPRAEQEKEADWLARVWNDSKEQARKAADRGTAIHAAIQGYFEGKQSTEDMQPYIRAAACELRKWNDFPADHVWVPEHSFAHLLGFGGKTDLHCGGFVADVKTKEFGPEDDLKTWAEQEMQLGAYREGVEQPKARGGILYVSVTHPGLARLLEVPEKDLVKGFQCFKALLAYWQAKNSYFPNVVLQGIDRKSEPLAGAMPAAV